jgi:hypothetical protein
MPHTGNCSNDVPVAPRCSLDGIPWLDHRLELNIFEPFHNFDALMTGYFASILFFKYCRTLTRAKNLSGADGSRRIPKILNQVPFRRILFFAIVRDEYFN